MIMKISEYYQEAILYNYRSLILLIDMLVLEKKVATLNDSAERLDYFLQDKWSDYVNNHLQKYAEKRLDLFND
jgi:hypothetical protein